MVIRYRQNEPDGPPSLRYQTRQYRDTGGDNDLGIVMAFQSDETVSFIAPRVFPIGADYLAAADRGAAILHQRVLVVRTIVDADSMRIHGAFESPRVAGLDQQSIEIRVALFAGLG
jgi:hypothetical protein